MDKGDNKGEKSMELATKTNVPGSYSKQRHHKSKRKSQQVEKTALTTQQERDIASLEEFLNDLLEAAGQGAETDRAISQTQKEHTTAEETARIEKQTVRGTIIAAGLYGGRKLGGTGGFDALFGIDGNGSASQGLSVLCRHNAQGRLQGRASYQVFHY